MMKYIFQGLLILACINVCHMGWVYFNKLAVKKKQGRVKNKQLQKINATIDEELDGKELPKIEFGQVESDLEEFMKSVISSS